MNISISGEILAVVTLDRHKVAAGSAPVFIVDNQPEQEKTSLLIARILGGVVHDLENEVKIICRHG